MEKVFNSAKCFFVWGSLLCLIVAVSSCQRTPKGDYTTEETWEIAHQTEKRIIPGMTAEEVECIVVKSCASSFTETFYVPVNGINGFEYQVGYKYRIEVLITHLANPPQDDSNRRFALKKILSKEAVK